MSTDRLSPHAILLADGRVLVVGDDEDHQARAYEGGDVLVNSGAAELYDPSSGSWRTTAGLPGPRAYFAAVPLADGRVLVTGGLDAPSPAARPSPTPRPDGCVAPLSGTRTLASSYLFDPRREIWTRTGSLRTPRTSPTAIALRDGRVLVLGGYDIAAREPEVGAVSTGIDLVSYSGHAPAPPPSPANFGPEFTVPVLATAELYDPASGTWSPTGPMHFARYDAAAVRLADGRVLVVESGDLRGVAGGGVVFGGGGGAELYDPATGRFTITGDLPDTRHLEWAFHYSPTVGTLVALDDGGALLVGNKVLGRAPGVTSHGSWISDTRSFRYDVATGKWSEVGSPSIISFSNTGTLPEPSPVVESAGDGGPANALVVKLAGGRVLAVGGEVDSTDGSPATGSAELFFPATDSWVPLAPLPQARSGGAAVALPDGTALLVGGHTGDGYYCSGLDSTVRFMPGR
jgi:hypothetical protein